MPVTLTYETKSVVEGTPANAGQLLGILGLTVATPANPIPPEQAKSSVVTLTNVNKS